MSSDYAKVWHARTTPHWKATRDLNLEYFRMVEEKMNARLQENGVLSIQEVFDYMGLKETSYSKTHGWVAPGPMKIIIAFEASPTSCLIDFDGNGKVVKIDGNVKDRSKPPSADEDEVAGGRTE